MKYLSKNMLITFTVWWLTASLGCQTNKEAASKEDRPNFLFLFTDDQTYKSIHALNNTEVQTPNMDRLVEEGFTFSHCFNMGAWGGAVCVASRAMLNTGQYMFAAREGIKRNQLWGETLGQSGYETFLTGKWHNGDSTALKSFRYAKSIGKGMYETMHPELKWKPGYGRPTPENNMWTPWDPIFTGHWTPTVWDIVYEPNGSRMIGPQYTVQQHTSDLYADKAIDFLETTVRLSDNPFFMYVAFNAPHDPRQSPKEYVDLYPPDSIKIPENYMPEHPFDQGDHRLRDENLAPFPRTEQQVQVHRSEYYAIITHMDHEIGRILKALENSGKEEDTYIILSSDHGLAVGHHGLMGKQNQYDHSIRMPLVIKGPGIEPGAKSDALVYLQSMFATTCDYAGISVPETVDFPSLKGLIEGQQESVHDAIFGNYRDFQRMIRTDKYKLIIYPHIEYAQLFDIQKDPEELVNLIDKEEYAPVKQELFNSLKELQREVGDTLQIELP
jgi:choline-sulfatase